MARGAPINLRTNVMFTGTGTPDYQDTIIENDGFWPDLMAGNFERRRGSPGSQDPENIVFALVASISEVNKQLQRLKRKLVELGVSKVCDVDSTPKIEGKNNLVIQYERAVFSRAKADLMPDFATVHQKDAGKDLAERAIDTRSELLAESNRIIRNMMGMNRSSVELI